MTETETTSTSGQEGQPSPDVQPSGQSDAGAQAQSGTTSEETFFDPKSLPTELMGAYKQMQAAFTKKSQAIARDRDAVRAYRDFEADPVGSLQRIARQYGYSLSRAEAKEAISGKNGEDWTPSSWGDVLDRAKAMAKEELYKELSPMFSDVQAVRKSNIERQLEELDPGWRQYEDEMSQNLADHPSLARDPAKLYRLSVPDEVWESRATQKALNKLQGKVAHTKVSGGSKTSREEDTEPKAGMSFAEAVEWAKRRLKADGKDIPPGF